MQSWIKTCLAFVVVAAAQAEAAQCLGRTSLGAAKSLVSTHYGFYKNNPEVIKHFVSPALYGLLKHENACKAANGACALQVDPWLGTRHGEMGDKLRFVLREGAVARSVVVIHYDYYASPSSTVGNNRSVEVHLQRRPSDECWIVLDIAVPGYLSLAEVLSRRYAEQVSPLPNKESSPPT